uniref:Uncharacterized protein n=1 Tax=Pinguiococcus pyrenoidosus TaxID=172671 RepID=A0A6U0USU7_9STRA|mmetsp:Transcript_1818/g.7931  ORF Transcript_1818/g.7931 Transcript_1818/m.7931 type:complete len:533 (+) Transcript_1818:249-1847(+)
MARHLSALVALLCVLAGAAHDVVHMSKDELHGLFSMSTSESPIDRRLEDPSQDDQELRDLIAAAGLAPLCVTGILRNVGTPEAPEIGCCDGECFMCMARGCGLFNSMLDIATLQFPGIAPKCCYQFIDFRTDMDRGIATRTCELPEDTGCLLPDIYNDLNSPAPSAEPIGSPVMVSVPTVLLATVPDPLTTQEFDNSSEALYAAMANQTEGLDESNFECTSIDVNNQRRLRIAGVAAVRKLQDSGGTQSFGINLLVEMDVSSIPPGSPEPFPEGISETDAEKEIKSQIDGIDLEGLRQAYVDGVLAMGLPRELEVRLVQTRFEDVSTDGGVSVPGDSPSAAPTTSDGTGVGERADSSSVTQGSFTNNSALALCLLGFVVLVVGGTGYWYRNKNEKANNQQALLQLKVDPNAAFSGVLSDDYDSVYLPPVLPGRPTRSSSRGSVDRSSTPRSAASRSRAASGRLALRRQLSNRSMRSASEASDRTDPRLDRRGNGLLVVNELDMLTGPATRGPPSFDGSSESSETASSYSSRS